MELVRAVAAAEGVDPEELDFVVEEYVETDAIELLATHEGASWTLSFELPRHNVTVTSDGLILVDGSREETWAPSQL